MSSVAQSDVEPSGTASAGAAEANENERKIKANGPTSGARRGSRHLSQGLEQLRQRLEHKKATHQTHIDFDVIIIGSGYGGAAAAASLSPHARVCVLERGEEYLAGSFPQRAEDLPSHVRATLGTRLMPMAGAHRAGPTGKPGGLFDFRIHDDVNVLVANGLGGGSLINAGVMIRARDEVFARPGWPAALRTAGALHDYYSEAERLLGAGEQAPNHYTPATAPAKFHALQRLATGSRGVFKPADITVALSAGDNVAGVPREQCIACGHCATGCNFEAKNSLDTTLLHRARAEGAEIFTGATVLRLKKARVDLGNASDMSTGGADLHDGWCVELVHTDPHWRSRQTEPLRLHARYVIVCAGTLGSTEILLRSQTDELRFSTRLGQQFSCNGDAIVTHENFSGIAGGSVDTPGDIAHAVASQSRDYRNPKLREVGPTITAMIDAREQQGLLFQELAVPGPLARVFEELVSTARTLQGLGTLDKQSVARDDDLTPPGATPHLHAHHPNDAQGHGHPRWTPDEFAVNRQRMRRTAVYAVMGDDGAQGSLELMGDASDDQSGDGALRIHWPRLTKHPLYQQQIDALRDMAQASHMGGTLLPNPMWRPLPATVNAFIPEPEGPALSVHPLGGCAMGDDATTGVVNHLGQVFDGAAHRGDPGAVHAGLYVMDGAIIPSALGANPSLTITALTLRACEALRASLNAATRRPHTLPTLAKPRPCLTRPFEIEVRHAQATCFEMLERLHGEVFIGGRPFHMELTVNYHPAPMQRLISVGRKRLRIRGTDDTGQDRERPRSLLRLYHPQVWRTLVESGASENDFHAAALAVYKVSTGHALVLAHESSQQQFFQPVLWAWLANRGVRDAYQSMRNAFATTSPRMPWRDPLEWLSITWRKVRGLHPLADLREMVRSVRDYLRALNALNSHIRKQRSIRYVLQLSEYLSERAARKLDPQDGDGDGDGEGDHTGAHTDAHTNAQDMAAANASADQTASGDRDHDRTRKHTGNDEVLALLNRALHNATLSGSKHIGYGRRSNPWFQFENLTLSTPGVSGSLTIDYAFLARHTIPLLRYTRQDNLVTGLGDMAAFTAYLARLVISHHLWSFRLPDEPVPGQPNRLAGEVPGLPKPAIHELAMGTHESGLPVMVRLTHYAQAQAVQEAGLYPLVCLHGYSASSTTFAHPDIPLSIAKHYWMQGREVWLIDLRTSPGLYTAVLPWSFEDVALQDIPAAFDFIASRLEQDGRAGKVDVLAHCMGSAMLSMAILKSPEPGAPFYREREALPRRINRLVLSQFAPATTFTAPNQLRAYVLNYFHNLLRDLPLQFRRSEDPGMAETLLDRVLNTVEYPRKEFDIENPPWYLFWRKAPFVGTRHRVDALYGVDVHITNLARATLNSFDDLFGPLNMGTVSQNIHFAEQRVITNREGFNDFLNLDHLVQRWTFPTLSIHGEFNGLFDPSTLERMSSLMQQAGRSYYHHLIRGYGHQDCMIGKHIEDDVLPHLDYFLHPEFEPAARNDDVHSWLVQAPWVGPIIGPELIAGSKVRMAGRCNPALGRASHALLLRVQLRGSTTQTAEVEIEIEIEIEAAAPRQVDPLVHVIRPDCDEHGWFAFDLPSDLQPRPNLVLLLYPQVEALADTGAYHVPDDLRTPTDPNHAHRFAPDLNFEFELIDHGDALLPELDEQRVASALRKVLDEHAHAVHGACFHHWPEPELAPCTTLKLALASCQYGPAVLDQIPGCAAYHTLANSLDADPGYVDCLLLLGDQVYVDATAGLFDAPAGYDRFARPFERFYRLPGVGDTLRRLPTYMLLDDHEMVDNWEPPTQNGKPDPIMLDGRAAYLKYERGAGPEQVAPQGQSSDPMWYAFTRGGHYFFMADTRSERSWRQPGKVLDAAIMSPDQWANIRAFLRHPDQYCSGHPNSSDADVFDPKHPRFICAPPMLFPRHRAAADGWPESAIASDSWDGYPASLYALLAEIHAGQYQHVVVLGGDEHLSCDAQATVSRLDEANQAVNPITLRCIHNSALYAPYPFANGDTQDLIEQESFEWNHDRQRYRCEVSTRSMSTETRGQFTRLKVARDAQGQWQINADFILADLG